MTRSTAFRFGSFFLDGANQQLIRGSRPVALTPKSFAVLTHLLERAGRLVSKDELLEAVWPGVHVGDAVLKTSVREIRRALNDPARSPVFIETVHRRGYRFIATTTAVMPSQPDVASPAPRDAAPHPGDARATTATRSLHLVGRDAELDGLERCLARVLEGQRQVVFITGEPGVGKTTLVDLFVDRAADRGIWATRGQCLPLHGAGEAYMPVLDALGRLGRRDPGDRVVGVLRRHAPTWLVQMPSLVGGADRDRLLRETLGSTRERMLREMAEALEALTADTPLVLVLEDLHWSDYSTLDLVASLARRREPARLLVLGTFRPVDVIVRAHPLRGVKQELVGHGQCEELRVELLPAPAVHEYLTRRFPDGAVSPELAEVIHRRTDGHPLFMVSLVDYLLARGALQRVHGAWSLTVDTALAESAVPDSVRDVIDRQLDELDAAERELLETASVAGLEFPAALVAEALATKTAAVEALCQRLAQGGRLLTARGVAEWPDGSACGRYGFVHSLYRDAVYQWLPATRRLALHRRIAESMECLHGSHASHVAAELATHFEQGHDAGRAVHYLMRAAENAARRSASRDATDHLTRALDLLDRVDDAAREDLRLALLERRGLLRRARGLTEEAVEDFDALAAFARQQGRADHEARALFYLASAVFAVDGDRCLAAAQRAVALGGDVGDELFQARTRGSSGYWHSILRGWRPDDARACAEAAAAAQRNPDRALLSLLLARSSYFERLGGNYRAAVATAEEGSRLALEVGDAYEYLFCQYSRSQALLLLGHWADMLEAAAMGGQMAQTNGSRLWRVFFELATTSLHLQALDVDDAAARARRAIDEAREIRHPYCELLGLILLASAELHRGDAEAAHDCLAMVASRMEAGGPRDFYLRMPLLHGLSEYWLERSDIDRAHGAAAELWEMAAQPGERTWMALGARMLARAGAARGDRDGAQAEIDRALGVLEGADAPLAAWRVHATAAELCEGRGDLDQAGRRWQASADAVRQLAASLPAHPALRRRFLESSLAQRIMVSAELSRRRRLGSHPAT
jgi:DNA-binding winged helix-turn-helix (wHTH) protein